MPTDLRHRIRTPYTPRLDLPPAFKEVALREVGDAFAQAQRIAPTEGAGTLVWVRRFDLVEFALVLEPEEPLAAARRAHYAGMCALYDALAVYSPPEQLIQFVWPDAILVDGGLIAGGRLAWPQGSDEREPPPWLVFGGMVRAAMIGASEPGARPNAVALDEVGFEDLESGRMIETFARHFMVWVDVWQQDGFFPIAQHYLQRLPSEEPVERTIDGVGDLLTRKKGKVDQRKGQLVAALRQAAWYDAQERGLRL